MSYNSRDRSRSPYRNAPTAPNRQNTLLGDSGAEDTVRNFVSNYEEVQKKALTKWVNSKLAAIGEHVNDLGTDLRDGKRLLKLLQTLSKDQAPKPESKSMRIHHLSNVQRALTFLTDQLGEGLPNIGNEDIVNGDVKKTLALIFFIMLKYQMQGITEDAFRLGVISEDPEDDTKFRKSINSSSKGDAKLALLQWVNIQLNDFKNVIRPVQDFHRSWRSGLAFSLLIFRHDPSLMTDLFQVQIPTTRAHNEPRQWRSNLRQAFDVARDSMGIPELLDPEDLADVEYPDEPSVMMYVAEYYKVMSKAQREESPDVAVEKAEALKAILQQYEAVIPEALGVPELERPEEEFVMLQEPIEEGEELVDSRELDIKSLSETRQAEEPFHEVVAEPTQDVHEEIVEGEDGEDMVLMTEETDIKQHEVSETIVETAINSEEKAESPVEPPAETPVEMPKPVEKPVPAPAPASPPPKRPQARKNSTLNEEDKLRLRNNVSDILRKQLAGVLPRGVHPILDKFLDIEDNVLAWINTQKSVIGTVPEASTVKDMKIFDQMFSAISMTEGEVGAKDEMLTEMRAYKEELMVPPDEANDDYVKLTTEQIFSVGAHYENLVKDLKDFGQHVARTKSRAKALRLELGDFATAITDYETRAENIRRRIHDLRDQVNDIPPSRAANSQSREGSVSSRPTSPTEDEERDLDQPRILHPIECSEEDLTIYEKNLQEAEKAVNEFNEADWLAFSGHTEKLPGNVRKAIEAEYTVILNDHKDLQQSLAMYGPKFEAFKRGFAFAQATLTARRELEFIQNKMVKTTNTDTGIQDLEDRAKRTKELIEELKVTYADLLDPQASRLAISTITEGDEATEADEAAETKEETTEAVPQGEPTEATSTSSKDPAYQNHFDDLVQKYDTVQDWVEEVRVWFTQAEYIREWIEVRINILEGKADLDPLASDLLAVLEVVEKMNQEHEALSREIAQFNTEDMTRLRTHVKELTGADRKKKDLSPADTTTIDITLTTLTTLDRLMNLMRKRTYDLQILTLRAQWEDDYEKSVNWVETTNIDVDNFLKGKARWKPYGEDDGPIEGEQNPQAARARKQELIREQAISTLVNIEQQFADFDQNLYSNTMDSFQDMSDASNVEVPEFLEGRQAQLEDDFAVLHHRVKFARDVVSQRLSVMDFLNQAEALRDEGERLRQDIENAELTAKPGDSDKEFTERVAIWQERLIQLVTGMAARIPFPTPSNEEDEKDNLEANDAIHSAIGSRKSTMVSFGESLNAKLNSYRQILVLHRKAKGYQEEIAKLNSWIDERTKSVRKAKVDVFVGKLGLDEDDLMRLEKERDGQISRLKSLEENDVTKLQSNIEQQIAAVEQAKAVSVDKDGLLASLDGLYHNLDKLRGDISAHSIDLDVLGRRIAWENHHTKANQWVSSTSRKVWDFIGKKAQWRSNHENLERPTHAEDDDIIHTYSSFKDRVNDFEQKQLIPAEEAFNILTEGFNLLASESFPEHLAIRQAQLKDNFSNLTGLMTYTDEVIGQRTAMIEYLINAQDVQHESEKCREAIVKATRRVMEDENPQFEDRIRENEELAIRLWETSGSVMPYPPCPDGARATRPASEKDNVNDSISAVVLSRKDALENLGRVLWELNKAYIHSVELKGSVHSCRDEAARLKSWLDEKGKELAERRVDVVSETFEITQDDVEKMHELHGQFVKDVEDFEANQMATLRSSFEALIEEIHKSNSISVDITTAVQGLDDVSMSLKMLQSQLACHLLDLGALGKRVEFEGELSDGMKAMESLNDSLRELTTKKDGWLANDANDSEGVTLAGLQEDLQDLGSRLKAFVQAPLQKVQTKYDEFGDLCRQLDGTPVMPDHIDLRMTKLNKSVSRLQESLDTRSRELAVLSQRVAWEKEATTVSQWCTEMDNNLESFIRDKARWTPECPIEDVGAQEDALKAELAELKRQVAGYEKGAVASMQLNFDALQSAATDLSSAVLPEHVQRKKSTILSNIKRLHGQIAYAEEVVAQRSAATQFVVSTIDLEKGAEALREKFLAAHGKSPDQYKEVKQFDMEVSRIINVVGSKITYPTRSYEGLSSKSKAEDENANTVLQETVKARTSLLKDLLTTLHALIESNERFSRRRMAIQSYMKQAEDVRVWIIPRLEVVRNEAQDHVGKLNSVEHLRESLGKVEAVDAAVKAYGFAYTSLKMTVDKIMAEIAAESKATTDEDDLTKAAGDSALVREKQAEIDELWQKLSLEAPKVKRVLSAILRLAEFMDRGKNLLETCDVLIQEITAANHTVVTDDEFAKWQQHVEELDEKELGVMQEQIAFEQNQGEEDRLKEEDITAMESKLQQSEQKMFELKQVLAKLLRNAKRHRMSKAYFEDAAHLESLIAETMITITDCKQANGLIKGNSADEDKQIYQALANAFRTIELNVSDRKDQFDNLCSYYKFIKPQEVERIDEIDELQKKLEADWQRLQLLFNAFKDFSEKMGRWYECHGTVYAVEDDLLVGVKERLDKLAATGWNMSEPEIEELNTRITTGLEMLADARSTADTIQVLENEELEVKDRRFFNEHHDRATASVSALATSFEAGIQTSQKATAFANFRAEVDRMQTACHDQAETITNRLEDLHRSAYYSYEVEVIEKALRKLIGASAESDQEYQKLTRAFNSQLKKEADRLVSTYGFNRDKVNEILKRVSTGLTGLEETLNGERRQTELVRKIFAHAKTANDIRNWMTGARVAVTNLPIDVYQVDEADQRAEVEDLEQKLAAFEPTVAAFREMASKIFRDDNTNKRVDGVAAPSARDAVEERAKRVMEDWESLKELLASARANIGQARRGVEVARKVKEIMMLLGDIKEHVNNIQLTPPEESSMEVTPTSPRMNAATIPQSLTQPLSQPLSSMPSERDAVAAEADLGQLDREVEQHLQPKINDLDIMITNMEDEDGAFIRHRAEIAEAMTGLMTLMETKRFQIAEALRLGGFLTVADELDILMGALLEVVEKSSPHHARLIENTLSKADLQAMLIELDTRYKYYEPKIVEKIEETRQAASNLTDDWRVEERLGIVSEQWAELQALAAAKREEILRCIERLEHPYFSLHSSFKPTTSTPRSRKISLPSAKAPARDTLSPPPGGARGGRTTGASRGGIKTAASASASRRRVSSKPALPASTSDGSNPDSSKPRTRASHTPRRPSRTPAAPNHYVADPKNDLDILLGRIVNEMPHKVTVKMVPGEVGKYWFGDVDPKLAYCRILRGGMVMVRVGGGWEELSKFLMEHGAIEGKFSPTPKMRARSDGEDDTGSIASDGSSYQEAFLTMRANSTSPSPSRGFSPIGSSRSTPRSSLTPKSPGLRPASPNLLSPQPTYQGKKEGDKFSFLDGTGHSVLVRMKKAGDNAVSPVVPRKKD
ncbi:hypothetical protein BC937DRAFT_94730 [Endogone sp. FLAS-F59071]|nr:hypothetical protein BC937DRAFT_94730 [Endogone sp. FLAS-F59071]|eukprot:RUS20638.1 hypothetical protein BC937DRAFT_94730 [Endogone sp. FLAS-F59071]